MKEYTLLILQKHCLQLVLVNQLNTCLQKKVNRKNTRLLSAVDSTSEKIGYVADVTASASSGEEANE